ncbi:hypothetical protein [Mesorhizobium sp. B2-3-5]|uniref:hypothetical protein n=1 Tax=Mesorhizobium sp. B2-3-5 TaxID=2589958 RepID=UPI0015E47EE8|nr:hypothetical protein [Mesorhizobium sp. B2-3-5]
MTDSAPTRALAGMLVIVVVDDGKQLLDPVPPNRRHNPELGHMGRNASISA